MLFAIGYGEGGWSKTPYFALFRNTEEPGGRCVICECLGYNSKYGESMYLCECCWPMLQEKMKALELAMTEYTIKEISEDEPLLLNTLGIAQELLKTWKAIR